MARKKKDVAIVKYSNKLNDVPLTNFNKSDLNFFYAICSQVKDKGATEVVLTFKELAKMANYGDAIHQDRLRADLNVMRDKVLNAQWQYIVDNKKDRKGNLFRYIDIDLEEPIITIKLDEDFLFLFNEIANQFTRFELEEYVSLPSRYSKMLYRYLKQWRTQGHTPEWKVNQLKEMLDAPDYPPGKLLERVINPAMEDMKKTGAFKNLWVEIIRSEKGRGRPVEGYIFHFGKEEVPGQISARTSEEWNKALNTASKNVDKKIQEKNAIRAQKTAFNGFEQRKYDYKELEKQLLSN